MRHSRVKKLKKDFVKEFGRSPEKVNFFDKHSVARPDEFRSYKKQYLKNK